MMHRFLILLLVPSVFAGCVDQGKTAKRYDDWYKLQDQLAEVINKNTGDVYYHVAPIKSGIQHAGAVLASNYTLAYSCQNRDTALQRTPIPPMPAVSDTSNFVLNLGTPSEGATGAPQPLLNAIGIASARAGISNTASVYISLGKDQTEALLPDVHEEARNAVACLRASGITDFAERDYWYVRGYRECKMVVRNKREFKADAAAQVEYIEGFKVSFDRSGGFELEDDTKVARFYILMHFGPNQKESPPDNLMEAHYACIRGARNAPEREKCAEALLDYAIKHPGSFVSATTDWETEIPKTKQPEAQIAKLFRAMPPGERASWTAALNAARQRAEVKGLGDQSVTYAAARLDALIQGRPTPAAPANLRGPTK